MTFDLKYALPFVMPFVFLALIRGVCWVAAAEWSEPGIAVVLSLLAGQFVGWIAVAIMWNDGVSFVIRFPATRKGGEQ